MNIYSILALIIRIILAGVLFQTGKKALKSQTRNVKTLVTLIAAGTILVGFYTYLTSLLLLFYFGCIAWNRFPNGRKITKWIILILLVVVLFIKGPGQFALTHY